MALSTRHPQFTLMERDWVVMKDTYAGERAVKDKGQEYLPATPSQVIDGLALNQEGFLAYQRYLQRAVFWDFVSDGVEALLGLLHQKAPAIMLPARMQPMLKKLSREGETLEQLLRRINEQQLVYGRLGLLLDLPVSPADPDTLPYVALYGATTILNWDDSSDYQGRNILQLVVLNESGLIRTPEFAWEQIVKYRVLQLVGSEGLSVGQADPDLGILPQTVEAGTYVQGTFRSNSIGYNASEMKAPTYLGKTLKQIPFKFINSKDLIPHPDNPPLLGLAALALTIYRGEADYRQSLFMQGQDTLVIIGGSAVETPGTVAGENLPQRMGAGAKLDVNVGGDAKYIGVNSAGLPEQRMALENDKAAASSKAAQLVSPQAGKQESGDALHTRLAAQTATLKQIALTGAAGLEEILKTAAIWMGLNPDEVQIIPNTEFVDQFLASKDMADLMDARAKGAPLSLKSIHGIMESREMTTMAFDEEMKQIVVESKMPGAQPPVVTPPVKGASGTGNNGITGATGS